MATMEKEPQPTLPAEATDEVATAPTVEEVKTSIVQAVDALVAWVLGCQALTFFEFETQLVPRVLALGRLFVQLFLVAIADLCMREERFQATHPQPAPGYKRQGPNARLVGTLFGKVRYWRAYFSRHGRGYYPLDVELGLTGDGFSMALRSCAVRVVTKVSYAQTVLVLSLFLHWSPAQESIEGIVLGLGRHTAAWFAQAPAPEGDGEVLVIQIDSKATPTATDAELEKRRGPRAVNVAIADLPHPGSQRHRGRAARQRRGSKPRRQKGDKAKKWKDGDHRGDVHAAKKRRWHAGGAPEQEGVRFLCAQAPRRGDCPPGSG